MKNITIMGIKLKTLLFWLITSTIVFLFLIIFGNQIFSNLAPFNVPKAILLSLLVLLVPASLICSLSMLGIIIVGKSLEWHCERNNAKSFEIIKDRLSNEFTEVKLSTNGHPFKIYAEDMKCMAKLDENNNIVYRLQVDCEVTSDNYKTFTDYFEV